MTDTRYNGWTNYETWNLNLWLDNDQGTQEYWRERAEQIYRDTDPGEDRRSDATNELAEALKDETQENQPQIDNGFYADILSAAVSEVNWYEIAEYWISDVADEIDADEKREAAEADAG